MVVARSFTQAAIAFAADQPSLRIWTIDELERRLFDPRPYLESLKPCGETAGEPSACLATKLESVGALVVPAVSSAAVAQPRP